MRKIVADNFAACILRFCLCMSFLGRRALQVAIIIVRALTGVKVKKLAKSLSAIAEAAKIGRYSLKTMIRCGTGRDASTPLDCPADDPAGAGLVHVLFPAVMQRASQFEESRSSTG